MQDKFIDLLPRQKPNMRQSCADFMCVRSSAVCRIQVVGGHAETCARPLQYPLCERQLYLQ